MSHHTSSGWNVSSSTAWIMRWVFCPGENRSLPQQEHSIASIEVLWTCWKKFQGCKDKEVQESQRRYKLCLNIESSLNKVTSWVTLTSFPETGLRTVCWWTMHCCVDQEQIHQIPAWFHSVHLVSADTIAQFVPTKQVQFGVRKGSSLCTGRGACYGFGQDKNFWLMCSCS